MKKNENEYKKSGVDVNAGYESIKLIKPLIEKTKTKEVLGNIGGFNGLFQPNFKNYKTPVLVSSTDGVGTKIKIAIKLNIHNTIGIDCVAMCVNDIICSKARPLFFLDYIACGKNNPEKIKEIVKGITKGCIESEMALIGGETAEHPKIIEEKDYDLAGFVVGIVEKEKIPQTKDIKPKDLLIALPSSGLHSNGFSLVREIFKKEIETSSLEDNFEILQKSLKEELLTPTTIYVKPLAALFEKVNVKTLCHITGGGFYENIPRMLPENLTATIYKKNLKIHNIFKLIMQKGNIKENNMFEIFNMGVGMVLVVSAEEEEKTIKILNENNVKAYTIGEIGKESEKVKII